MNEQVYKTVKTLFEAIPMSAPKAGPIFRGWLENEKLGYKVYLRITHRYLGGDKRLSVEIGSVEVQPEFEGKGVFSSILKACEDEAVRRNCCAYVESILNPIILNKLKREGYIQVEGLPDCRFKDFANG